MSESKRNEKSEASGLLMSIVRTLTSSSDVGQREQERIRLEKAFKESDRRLDNHVNQHLTDLTSIMQAFNKISSRITTSQDKIADIRKNLLNCKNLLHCKRDDLRRLWVEGIESKTICSMIDKIEKLKDAGDRVRMDMDKRNYLSCSKIITESLNDLECDLAEVNALVDVKRDLIARKDELYNILVDKLNKQMYVRWMGGIVHSLNRQGSSRQSTKAAYLKLQLKPNKDKLVEKEEKMLQLIMQADLPAIAKMTNIHEVAYKIEDENPVEYVCMLIEALATLRHIPDSIDYLRSHLRPGLVAIIQETSRQVCNLAYVDGEDLSEMPQPQLFLDLLLATFAQFKVVAMLNNIVIANFTRIKNTKQSLGDFQIYDSIEVWNKMQIMTIIFNMEEYSISFTFVCRPSPTNITVVYNPLQAFIKEIENATNSKPGSLALQGFVKEFIEKTFLLQIQYQTEAKEYTNPEGEEKRIISSNWAKDVDINRFLRSLPNWKNLKSISTTPTGFISTGDMDDPDDIEMSERDLRAMNLKESNVLTANLSAQSVTSKDIIQDGSHLRVLANLCESLTPGPAAYKYSSPASSPNYSMLGKRIYFDDAKFKPGPGNYISQHVPKKILGILTILGDVRAEKANETDTLASPYTYENEVFVIWVLCVIAILALVSCFILGYFFGKEKKQETRQCCLCNIYTNTQKKKGKVWTKIEVLDEEN